jgi:outer membrane receptor protein involved in Fe transport
VAEGLSDLTGSWVVLVVILGLIAPASATELTRFDLPTQSLADALRVVGDLTNHNILFDPALVQGRRAPALKAELPLGDALNRLLQGTGLVPKTVDDKTINIVPAPVKPETASPAPKPRQSLPDPAVRDSESGAAPAHDGETHSTGFTKGDQAVKHGSLLSRVIALLGICTVAGGAGVVCAEDAAQTAASETPQEVVVTGSRVISNGNNSPTPLTVVQADDVLKLQPTTIADALNTMPVFSGPRTQVSNPNASLAGGAGGNAASNQLNLRNLGAQRTLVLFDGHRMAPTSTNGVVDIDMVPQMLLQRVDIVTGGVSAVYGSDAISGVVNFVTDRNFNGMKVTADAGVSSRYDDREIDGGIAGGTSLFDGRGHIEGSYEYRDDTGILHRSSRPWLALVTVQGSGTAAAPLYIVNNSRRSAYTFGGLITSGLLSGQQFASNGVLTAFNHGVATTTPGVETGGDGAYFDGSLKAPLRSNQLFGRLDYDFTDSTHLYVEGAFNDKTNQVWTNWQQLTNVTLSSQNPFLSSTYSSQLAAASQPTFKLSKFLTDAPRLEPSIESRQIFANVGVNGEFGNGYKWDVGYVHSDAKLLNTEVANLNNLRLAASLDAVINPANGQVACNVTLTNPGLYPGCVPLNPFGPTAENPSAVAYVLGNTHFNAFTSQDDVSGSLSGAPFSTWDGPVTVALSAEWRHQSYHADSDATPSDTVDCTGLHNTNCPAQVWFQSFAPRTPVGNTVSEGAVEFEAPLLKDLPLAQALNLNGAARYTHYETSGSYTTWKAGGDWHLNDSLRFRATRSRDIRAPTLDDLYSPAAVTFGAITDQLLHQTSTAPSSAQGNPNLTAEIGNTTTAGFVFTPASLPNFSMTLDGYNINVTNSIYQLQGTTNTTQFACYNSGGSSPACALIIRPLGPTNTSAANAATLWINSAINIASIHTYGADLEANLAMHAWGRPMSLRALATYQPHVIYTITGISTFDMGGVSFGTGGLQAVPKVRLTGFLRYAVTDRIVVDVMERWRSRLKISNEQPETGPDTGSVAYTNLTLTYDLKMDRGDLQTFLNVQNLLDRKPPPAAFSGSQLITGQFGGFAIGDDPIGRYYMLGLRYRR